MLLLLAREFRAQGHHVTLLGYEFDIASRSGSDRICEIPQPERSYQRDVEALRWLENNWRRQFVGERQPHIVLTAGWPFLSCIPFFEHRGSRVFYQDHGVIPKDDLPEIGQRAIGLLAELKAVFVPQGYGIVAISRFILETQSSLVAQAGQPLACLLHGADHAGHDFWGKELSKSASRFQTLPEPRLLLLGRFEPGTYKRSERIFALEKRVRVWAPHVSIGVLASDAEVKAAGGDETRVVGLGHVSDRDLFSAITSSDVCLSVSDWEGFNLPLAEAQVLGRPCLVLDRGAHREVVAHPWLVCSDIDEMAEKTRLLVAQQAPPSLGSGDDFRVFARQRRWKPVAGEYLQLFASAIRAEGGRKVGAAIEVAETQRANGRKWLVMDVTNACLDESNTGCIRVARRLSAELQLMTPVLFVAWDGTLGGFRFPTTDEMAIVGRFNGPIVVSGHPWSTAGRAIMFADWMQQTGINPDWLILPEIRNPEDLRSIQRQAQALGIRTAAIFHDAIPVLRPDLVTDPRYRDTHFDYMCGLARCDAVLANSHYSEECLVRFWRDQNLVGSSMTCVLPGGSAPKRPPAIPEAERAFEGRKFILCVSTVEPRKNHRRMVEAFLELKAERPGFDLELILVGNRYAGAPELGEWLDQLTLEQRGVRWLGVVPDELLFDLYRNCELTIYPSEIEGFGLPIVESIWYGRPCLCHNQGVMSELAEGGGCLTADLTNVEAFRLAIAALAGDRDLLHRLEDECRTRSIKRWSDYAAEFLALLAAKYWSDLAPVQ